MLLSEIDRDGRTNDRLLNRFISLASGVRLPDASRVAFKNKAFFGVSMGAWTQTAMRGPSAWSIGEREMMATMVAKWNGCAFCADVHGAVAAKHLGRATVDAVLSDYYAAPISEGLKVTLEFLEIMTLRPEKLTQEDAKAVLSSGISAESLTDAIAICAVFNLLSRYANALDFSLPTAEKLHRMADTLVKMGYPL
jgi:uncharacterized peroxidase-related enzyme